MDINPATNPVVSLTAGVTGTLPVANGGTGTTSSIGSGSVILGTASSYTGTATGMTSSPTGTINYVLTGSSVVIDIPAISGTSNSGSFTITGAPVAIRPASNKSFLVRVSDNSGAIVVGLGGMDTSGVIQLFLTQAGGAFTGSGTKATASCSAAYTLA